MRIPEDKKTLYRNIQKVCVPKHLIYVLSCLALIIPLAGCKGTDKGKPTMPFFREGAPGDPAVTGDLSTPPPGSAGPIVVQNGVGPAVPSSAGSSLVSGSSTTGTYAPPDLMPSSAGTTMSQADGSASPSTYMGGTTTVYSVPSGTNTNEGGVAGSISDAYSSPATTSPYSYGTSPSGGSSYGSSPYGTGSSASTPGSSPYGTGSSASTPGSSPYGTGSSASTPGSSPYGTGSSTSTLGSSPYGTGGSESTPGSSPYGTSSPSSSGYGTSHGTSTPGSSGYNGTSTPGSMSYGTMSGQTTTVSPRKTILDETQNELAAHEKKYRVINGKRYELVQYIETPPILPDIQETQQTPPLTSDFQQVTPLPVTQTFRTAGQMTKAWGRIPIPSYDTILNQPDISFGQSRDVFTFTEPVKMTIMPSETEIEQVTSLEHSQYEHLGALAAPSTAPVGTIDSLADEMKGSIWTVMARQDNNFLLNSTQKQAATENQNAPTYLPLSNPLAPYAAISQNVSDSGATLSQPGFQPQVTSSGVILGQSSICCPCVGRYILISR